MRVIALQSFALLLCSLAVLLATGAVGVTNAETSAASSSSSDAPATATPTAVPAAVTTPASPSPVPVHSAMVNSDTFRVADNVVCPDIVAQRINAVYAKNKNMFTTCMTKSGYQIFPYSGKVPTADDISLMVQTPECMGVITAVALSDLPACSIGDMPVKAVVETLLKISVDMADGAKAPSAKEFHVLMSWRRDVNAAQAAHIPYDSDSELYAIFKKALWKAMTTTSVKVLSDLTIIYSGSSSPAAAAGSTGFTPGTVKPSNSTTNTGDRTTTSTSTSATTTENASVKSVTAPSPAESAAPAHPSAASSRLLVATTALAMLAVWMI